MSEVDSARRSGLPREVEGYGIGCVDDDVRPRALAKVGDFVIDLDRLQTAGHLGSLHLPDDLFKEATLNSFMSRGTPTLVDALLTDIIAAGPPDDAMFPLSSMTLYLPIRVSDFCDFYASEHHASNMGRILRPGAEALPAAWRHMPLGYHGRSGTVGVSGTTVRRPSGMVATPEGPQYLPTGRLDLEVELGYVIGHQSKQGRPVPVDKASDHIFGAVLVNDWSARDIQAFEYQPLGPFLGKSFATSISPWIVPLRALERFRVEGPEQGPEVPGHLRMPQPRAFDIHLELSINQTVVSRPEARFLHWSPEQLVAHLTSNGANLRPGDVLATGTISGPDRGTWGSLMELAWGGERPVQLNDGSTRAWLEDGDTVTVRAWCGTGADAPATGAQDTGTAGRVELGRVTGKISASAPGAHTDTHN